MPFKWTPEATAELLTRWEDDQSKPHIAAVLGTTYDSVKHQAQRLGLRCRDVGVVMRRMAVLNGRNEAILRLRREGVSRHAIARLLSISRRTVNRVIEAPAEPPVVVVDAPTAAPVRKGLAVVLQPSPAFVDAPPPRPAPIRPTGGLMSMPDPSELLRMQARRERVKFG